ncbi:hypothetical protein LIER_18039 [Lithospermum erythrorhizon]|uniref:Probable Ufm1-specific protease n=1 Tax=Lithospermum erythrorhizon TaxID=34254 RepID=A0AAV3QEZ7_LITER
MILPKGFDIVGALILKNEADVEKTAGEAIGMACTMSKMLSVDDALDHRAIIGAVVDLKNRSDVRFFVSRNGKTSDAESVTSIIYEDEPEKYVLEKGCILRCELPIMLPLYYPANRTGDVDNVYRQATEDFAYKLRDPQVTYIIGAHDDSTPGGPQSVILHGSQLSLPSNVAGGASPENSQELCTNCLTCSHFSKKCETIEKSLDKIQVSIMFNRSKGTLKPVAPVAEYFPATEDAKLQVVHHKLEVLCYAAKELSLVDAVSNLIIPALVDQLYLMRNMNLVDHLKQHLQLNPYHFIPSEFLHPITVIYELGYGETEIKQVDVRRSLHLRLGLPLDRPLLRIANAINLPLIKDSAKGNLTHRGSSLLKDVHIGIPGSGVAGGSVSLIQGSYEYHHYLQDGFDDSGWGCAYRSLQTIISWFRLQHYTSIDVPSHREIQQTLVEIGDKDPSLIGSRDWIGAIELSFVLDKLLGASCKVINVRSGAELPEKCRELALHFETQGTPIMIGGGVLAYTLLGVDYNEASGDCAFLILDPHYTGNEDIKKIVNGGWCGWKRAVDSKGKHFFLHDKFYNLLLPQRPNMV